MSSAMRFVACSFFNDRELLLLVGNRQAGSSLACRLHRNKQKWSSCSTTYPVSTFVLDNSSPFCSTKFKAVLEQSGSRLTASGSTALSSGVWSGFSDFFQRIVVQPTTGDEGSLRHELLQDMPLLQVCLKTTVPGPFDTDTAADDVLSQLLYAGLGSIGSTLDGLLSVVFPKMIKSEVDSKEELVKKPEAELCAVSARCVTAEAIGSLDAFYAWLQERLPGGAAQLELWGTAPGTKRVANLWRELLEGEISLEDSYPPKRTVHVASVRILNEAGKMLVEAYQEMADGRIRPRNRPLSEKMKPGESVEEACLRGILEELGDRMGARDKVVLLQESYSRQEEQRESFSYPGLMTTYVLHTVSAHIKQLPVTDFNTEEDEDARDDAALVSVPASGSGSSASISTSCAVGVRRHYWKWV